MKLFILATYIKCSNNHLKFLTINNNNKNPKLCKRIVSNCVLYTQRSLQITYMCP